MPIFLNILFLIIGMALLIKGADFFVSGASEVARRLKVPAMFVGLTIVSIGTSLPELSVSITSAISGSIDMAVGNIVGSNLFNMLLILGLVALFNPVKMESSTKKIDLPFLVAVTGILMLFGFDMFLNGETTDKLINRFGVQFRIGIKGKLIRVLPYTVLFLLKKIKKRISGGVNLFK